MFDSLHLAAAHDKIMTREVGYGASRVAFVCDLDHRRQVFLPEFSEIQFDCEPYHRSHAGISAVGIKKAVIRKYPGVPCACTLEFANGKTIACHELVPFQTARVLRVLDRRTKLGLAPDAEKLLFALAI